MSINQLQQVINELTDTVTQEVTVEESAIALIEGIPAMVQAAVEAALAAGNLTPAQLAAFDNLKATITASKDKLAAAVTANTPSQP